MELQMEKNQSRNVAYETLFPYFYQTQVGSQYFACGNLTSPHLTSSHLVSSHPIKYISSFIFSLELLIDFLIPNMVLHFFWGKKVSLLPTELGFFNCQCLRLQFNNNLNRPTFPPLTRAIFLLPFSIFHNHPFCFPTFIIEPFSLIASLFYFLFIDKLLLICFK